MRAQERNGATHCPAVHVHMHERCMAAETGPIRGTDRRSLAFAAEVASCAMTLSIRRSRSDGSVTAETLGDAEGCQHGQGEEASMGEVAHGGDIQPHACEGLGGDHAEDTLGAKVVRGGR